MDVDEFLAHNGVLGMKWGHRKGGNIVQRSAKSYIKKRNAVNEKLEPAKKSAQSLSKKIDNSKLGQYANEHPFEAVLAVGGAALAAQRLAKVGHLTYNTVKLAQGAKVAAAGARQAGPVLKAVGNLSVYALQKGANGAYG